MSFPTTVNVQPAPAVEGDFCSANARWNVIAGPGGLVSAAAGLTVGRFAWTDAANHIIAANTGGGAPAGFVHREQQASITTFLAENSMVIVGGQPVTLFNGGEFWVKNNGATEALYGQKAYAKFADGTISFAATGSPGTASGSASSVAAGTGSVTGSIADNVLTVTVVGSGSINPGGTISGASVATGTKVVSQVSGTAGGVGVYLVDIPEQTVASTTISETHGVLTVGGSVVAGFGVGQTITGSSVVTGTTITALGTGTGGAGTYIVNNNTVVSSTAITAAISYETKFFAMTSGLAGELVKMTSHTLG